MNEERLPELIILPTAEPNPVSGELNKVGKERLKALVRYARSRKKPYEIGIVGGFRTEGLSEAIRFSYAIHRDYPDLWPNVAWADATSYFSAHDFAAIGDYLRSYPGKISLVSHPDHLRRINLTLHKLGIKNVHLVRSHEPASYGRIGEFILLVVTIFDPLWEKWPTALLRKMVVRRVTAA